MATAFEITTICVDNSFWMYGHPFCMAQIEAIEYYCETKFKCNPENLVGLFQMASFKYGTLLDPTNKLQRIINNLPVIHVHCGGQVDFSAALQASWARFPQNSPNIKKRLLMFVGSPINLHSTLVETLGTLLKRDHVALDVVNFFILGDTSRVERSILYGTYSYARTRLAELVAIANDNDNSHMVDVDEPSSVCEIMSKTILKKNVRYLRKKDRKKGKENVSNKQEPEPVID